MDLRDPTKNQHFLPQVEQRLNAINTQVKSENQKIYSFSIRDRNSFAVSIDSEKGVKISKNLSLNDLFSFDVLGEGGGRYNFEKLFYDYETRIKINTESLLSKIVTPEADIKSAIINIFRFKILNFVRNPYSIEKILNTFCDLKKIIPNDPIHFESFNRVLEGSKPQQSYLCNQLGITEEDYRDWLATIFILLNSMEEDKVNFLDQTIIGILENPSLYTRVYIYTYDEKTCLLSDRGFNIYTKDHTTVWEFNLYSNGFIRYVFENIDRSELGVDKEVLDRFKSMPKKIDVEVLYNDLTALKIYNKHTVDFCHKHVFGASKDYEGVTVSL